MSERRRDRLRRRALLAVAVTLALSAGLALVGVVHVRRTQRRVASAVAAIPRQPSSAAAPPALVAALAPLRESDASSEEHPSCAPSVLWSWRHRIRDASDENVPPPPARLVEWLDEHGALIETLTRQTCLASDGELVALGPDGAGRVSMGRAHQLLMSAAALESWRGDRARASRRLEAAWRLNEAIAASPWYELDPRLLLGVLRTTRVDDPAAWLERLDGIDLRRDWADVHARRAELAWRRLHEVHDDGWLPGWLPRPVRRVANEVNHLPGRWMSLKDARENLDARDALLSTGPGKPLGSVVPRDLGGTRRLQPWLRPSRHVVADQLAWVAIEEAELALTREVVARRAGVRESSPDELFDVAEHPDGRITLRWRGSLRRLPDDHGRGWFGYRGIL